jgi:hypothetical protein
MKILNTFINYYLRWISIHLLFVLAVLSGVALLVGPSVVQPVLHGLKFYDLVAFTFLPPIISAGILTIVQTIQTK